MTYRKLFLPTLIIFFLLSCDNINNNQVRDSSKKGGKDGVKKNVGKDGIVKSEVTMKDGKRNGPAKNYYPSGKVSLEMVYKNDKKEGKSKRYYEDGTLFQETDYTEDKINGFRKKYREDGKLMSEARFEMDFPCTGLREFHLNGEEKKNYPKLQIEPVDLLKQSGKYLLKLSLSERARDVKYYVGRLSQKGCLTDKLEFVLRNEQSGSGTIEYYLSPGEFKMEELNIIASFETIFGNTQILQKSFYVSIDN